LEIIAHRILWSIPMLAGFLLLRDGPGFWRRMQLPKRVIGILCVSGTLIVLNWLVFVWAISNDQILATSLGYFITPLFSVLLGMIFLHERLTFIQIFSVSLAAVGSLYLTWYLGVAPWVSMALALSFGSYGLVRKKLNVGPMVGLLWETLLLAIPAIAYLAWNSQQGSLVFAHESLRLDLLLVLSGLVTMLPLVWFNVAARNMTLSKLGFFQYIGPSISFLLAVVMYGEIFTQGHAVAFSCIWTALLIVSMEPFLRNRRKETE